MTLSGEAERRVRDLLAEVYTPEGVDQWLRGRKRSLDGRAPIDLLHGSDADRGRVFTAIERLIAGNA